MTPAGELLIRDVRRERIPGPAQAEFLAERYAGVLKVESIGYQSALIQALARRGLPVEAVYPDKDKVTRASAAGALYKGGRVYHLRGAEWLHDFEHELLALPGRPARRPGRRARLRGGTSRTSSRSLAAGRGGGARP